MQWLKKLFGGGSSKTSKPKKEKGQEKGKPPPATEVTEEVEVVVEKAAEETVPEATPVLTPLDCLGANMEELQTLCDLTFPNMPFMQATAFGLLQASRGKVDWYSCPTRTWIQIIMEKTKLPEEKAKKLIGGFVQQGFAKALAGKPAYKPMLKLIRLIQKSNSPDFEVVDEVEEVVDGNAPTTV